MHIYWLENEEADFPCNDSLRIALPHVVVILLADFSFMVVMPCNPISCPVKGCLVNNIMIMVGQSKKKLQTMLLKSTIEFINGARMILPQHNDI